MNSSMKNFLQASRWSPLSLMTCLSIWTLPLQLSSWAVRGSGEYLLQELEDLLVVVVGREALDASGLFVSVFDDGNVWLGLRMICMSSWFWTPTLVPASSSKALNLSFIYYLSETAVFGTLAV